MSGSGFYKFRCKNFLTYNCENWVWVNHSACAECVAAGRDSVDSELQSDDSSSPSLPAPRCEIISPRRRVAAAIGFDLLTLFSEEQQEEEDTTAAAAMLRSRGFRALDGRDDVPGSRETSVNVHPCC